MDHRITFRIDEVLRRRGQSLYWLSRATGVSYTTLLRLTKDRALGINFATLEKLCAALGCLPGDLMEIGKEVQGKKTTTPAAGTQRRTPQIL